MSKKEENRKVLNAKTCYNEELGIKFRSKFEERCYLKLQEEGLEPNYECEKFTLMEGFYPLSSFYFPTYDYKKKKYASDLTLQTKKVISITYTPDIIIYKGDNVYWIECKGWATDTFKVKRRMILNFLDKLNEQNESKRYYYMEPHTLKQLKQCIKIIKS